MGSSRVHFYRRSIDARDAALEVWLRLLVGAIDERSQAPEWLAAARANWIDVATLGFGYGVIPELDAFIVDEERREVVLGLCASADARLRALGDPIPAATLNALGAGPADSWFTRDVPAAVFAEVAEDFTALVRDTPLGEEPG
jgi:hypothetical protein